MGINTNLLNFIDERVKKILSKLKILKYKPATVQSVNMDKVTVKFEDGTIMTLPNNSGSFVSPYIDSSNKVLVYYWGNTISENTAYIGKTNTQIVYTTQSNILNLNEVNWKNLYLCSDGTMLLGSVFYDAKPAWNGIQKVSSKGIVLESNNPPKIVIKPASFTLCKGGYPTSIIRIPFRQIDITTGWYEGINYICMSENGTVLLVQDVIYVNEEAYNGNHYYLLNFVKAHNLTSKDICLILCPNSNCAYIFNRNMPTGYGSGKSLSITTNKIVIASFEYYAPNNIITSLKPFYTGRCDGAISMFPLIESINNLKKDAFRVKHKILNRSEYDDLVSKDNNTIYYVTETDNSISMYRGDILINQPAVYESSKMYGDIVMEE